MKKSLCLILLLLSLVPISLWSGKGQGGQKAESDLASKIKLMRTYMSYYKKELARYREFPSNRLKQELLQGRASVTNIWNSIQKEAGSDLNRLVDKSYMSNFFTQFDDAGLTANVLA